MKTAVSIVHIAEKIFMIGLIWDVNTATGAILALGQWTE